jgi:hypothetical protein
MALMYAAAMHVQQHQRLSLELADCGAFGACDAAGSVVHQHGMPVEQCLTAALVGKNRTAREHNTVQCDSLL